jgi:hypothetical protein
MIRNAGRRHNRGLGHATGEAPRVRTEARKTGVPTRNWNREQREYAHLDPTDSELLFLVAFSYAARSEDP